MTTLYVTKYWGTKGILVVEGEARGISDKGMYLVGAWSDYVHPPDYSLSLEGAREHCVAAAARKIKSLRKQIAKIERIVSGEEAVKVVR